MIERVYSLGWVGLIGVCACSGGAGGAVAREPTAPIAVQTGQPASETATARESGALAYDQLSEADRVFVENAERAIGEYTQFVAHAGEREEYAQAVKRSREQIEDLRAEIIFVREGSAQRAAH